jgi:pectate lyase C
MKKGIVLALSILTVVALAVWFNCNPYQQQDNSSSLNVLDESNGTRLTISCTLDINGTTYDLGGAAITQASGNPLGDGSQAESQSPIARITNGTLKNGSITPPSADGVHLMGGTATLTAVSCSDIGEDYCTVKKSGTYTVSNLTANNGEDKLFQCNDLCTITYSGIKASGFSKAVRQNGGKTWKMTCYFNSSTLNNASECLWRSDSSSTTFFYRSITSNLAQSSMFGTQADPDELR